MPKAKGSAARARAFAKMLAAARRAPKKGGGGRMPTASGTSVGGGAQTGRWMGGGSCPLKAALLAEQRGGVRGGNYGSRPTK